MQPFTRWCLVLLASVACSSVPPRSPDLGPRGDARTITPADIADAPQLSLLDFLATDRPWWVRGSDGRPTSVIVYVDDAPVGPLSALRDVPLSAVAGAHYYDLAAAQHRYGGHLRTPVIAVTIKPH